MVGAQQDMRTAARVDANHGEIVAAFEACGCSVLSLASMGKGCPDLLIGANGRNFLAEVKNGANVPSARKLTPDELRFCRSWKGHWQLVEKASDVPAIVREWRKI